MKKQNFHLIPEDVFIRSIKLDRNTEKLYLGLTNGSLI